VAEIKDWTRRMGWDEDVAWAIIKKIREEGTDAIPFIEPTANKLSSIAKPICEQTIREYWATQRQV
jgi:predicted GNAT family acetyltransferase